MDDYNPKLPSGGRRPWNRRRIENAIITGCAIACLMAAAFIAFLSLVGQNFFEGFYP